jgi:hypothetical protein
MAFTIQAKSGLPRSEKKSGKRKFYQGQGKARGRVNKKLTISRKYAASLPFNEIACEALVTCE